MRLTVKADPSDKYRYYPSSAPNGSARIVEAVNKLGRMEDVEEKLGMEIGDLLSLDNVSFRWSDGRTRRMYVYGVDLKRGMILGKMGAKTINAKIKDYGSTWALDDSDFDRLDRINE